MCLPHNSDNFIILQPLPWGKSLLAPRFWGFTWPAAIRVLSRRNRENPGNEVDILISFPNGPFERDVILLLLPESIRWKKGDSAWIALSLWRSCSKNFSTTQSCFLSSNWFFECEHSLINKLMVTTEAAVPWTRLLGLGLKLYPSNLERMLNKDLTRFIQSLSRVRKNRPSERNPLLEGSPWLT